MACLGVLFSLSEEEVQKIVSLPSDEEKQKYLLEEIEENYFDYHRDRLAELDKSWGILHRLLTDGKLEWKNGVFPLNHVILGGKLIYDEDDFIMSLKTPEQVEKITLAIKNINESDLRARYENLRKKGSEIELTDEDLEYAWNWFDGSKVFWKKATTEKRYVLFTADQ